MATVQQPAGQPMFLPPGVAPQTAAAQPVPAMAPGTVMYYPQMGGYGGAVIMVRASVYTHHVVRIYHHNNIIIMMLIIQ